MKLIGLAVTGAVIAGAMLLNMEHDKPELTQSTTEFQAQLNASRTLSSTPAVEELVMPEVDWDLLFTEPETKQPTIVIPTLEERIAALPPCGEEDSEDCFWDAGSRGNGCGQSFYVLHGIQRDVGEYIDCP